MADEFVTLEKNGQVATVTVRRQKALNALNAEVLRQLHAALAEAGGDESVRVVLLTGEGEKSFVAGADISEFVGASPADALRIAARIKAITDAMAAMPKPVVADLVKMHALSLKDVIDAQAAKDESTAFMTLRTAAGHMQMIADPLAEATVKKFPDKFASLVDRPVQAQLAQPVTAEVSLFTFQPATLSVPVGTTVTWTNRDAIEHSVTATGAFDSGLFGQGGSFAHTFDAAGSYGYACSRHASMQGTVEVW